MGAAILDLNGYTLLILCAKVANNMYYTWEIALTKQHYVSILQINGDLHRCCDEFSYETIVRNIYETSQAKGPQDAAGEFVKRQADLAVLRGTQPRIPRGDSAHYSGITPGYPRLRGTVVIQNANDLFWIYKQLTPYGKQNQTKFRKGIFATAKILTDRMNITTSQ